MRDAIPERTVCDVTQLVEAAHHITSTFSLPCWWRGQAKAEWDLVPAVYRGGRNQRFECNAAWSFVNRAPSRAANTPAIHEKGGPSKWLFLMQHFGLPTRLLDWTESPLIAAFFAATEHEDVDGAVWALDPFKLNRAEGYGPTLAGSWNDEVLKVLLPAFNREMGSDSRILAILPTEVDVRMLTQLAAFTIHGRTDPLNSAREAPVFLMRFIIPASCKHAVRDGLRLVGIRRSTLFPDLQHLAQELEDSSWEGPSEFVKV